MEPGMSFSVQLSPKGNLPDLTRNICSMNLCQTETPINGIERLLLITSITVSNTPSCTPAPTTYGFFQYIYCYTIFLFHHTYVRKMSPRRTQRPLHMAGLVIPRSHAPIFFINRTNPSWPLLSRAVDHALQLLSGSPTSSISLVTVAGRLRHRYEIRVHSRHRRSRLHWLQSCGAGGSPRVRSPLHSSVLGGTNHSVPGPQLGRLLLHGHSFGFPFKCPLQPTN